MRLIDADKVKIDSRKHCIDCKLNGTKQCKTCVINLICDRMDLQPTVTTSLNLENISEEDIKKFKMVWHRANSKGLPLVINEEKQQGNWIEDLEYNNIFRCSECRQVVEMERKTYIFCPYCGADMRGDKNG